MRAHYKILLLGFSQRSGLTFHYTRLAISLKHSGNEVIVVSSENAQYYCLPEELNASNIRLHKHSSLGKANLIDIIKGSGFLKQVIEREGPFDIVLGGGVREAIQVFLSTRKLNRKPITLSIIGFLPRGKIERSIAALSYNFFYDNNIALCNYTKTELTKLGVNSSKVHVIPLFAPDLKWFDKAIKFNVDLGTYNLQNVIHPVIFYAARHDPYKGFEYYLMSAQEVLRKYDATFVIGGSGPLTGYLRRLAEKLGISEKVVFSGRISNYHMPFILGNIPDVCISTSLVEQLPSYILECMAARKPIVSSNVAGVPEIVEDGINGYLVPPCDYRQTARKIMNLLENPRKAREMGLAGRGKIERWFNMEASVNILMETCEDILGRK
ncbi:MAG: glycosyltransferase family 4 protein [Nitrososphaerota archaeon]